MASHEGWSTVRSPNRIRSQGRPRVKPRMLQRRDQLLGTRTESGPRIDSPVPNIHRPMFDTFFVEQCWSSNFGRQIALFCVKIIRDGFRGGLAPPERGIYRPKSRGLPARIRGSIDYTQGTFQRCFQKCYRIYRLYLRNVLKHCF
jgi:hypothetical protein